MKAASLITLLIAILVAANIAKADTRYSKYCVTSPSNKYIVLVYNDLITSEMVEGTATPKSVVNSVNVLKLNETLKLPVNSNFLHEFSNEEIAHYKKMTNFEVFLERNKNSIRKKYLFNSQKVSVRGADLITVKINNSIKFSIPYFETTEIGAGYGELVSEGLVFNGQKVSSVIYYDCGMDSN